MATGISNTYTESSSTTNNGIIQDSTNSMSTRLSSVTIQPSTSATSIQHPSSTPVLQHSDTSETIPTTISSSSISGGTDDSTAYSIESTHDATRTTNSMIVPLTDFQTNNPPILHSTTATARSNPTDDTFSPMIETSSTLPTSVGTMQITTNPMMGMTGTGPMIPSTNTPERMELTGSTLPTPTNTLPHLTVSDDGMTFQRTSVSTTIMLTTTTTAMLCNNTDVLVDGICIQNNIAQVSIR